MSRLVALLFMTSTIVSCSSSVEPSSVDTGTFIDAAQDVATTETTTCDSASQAPVACDDGTGGHDCCPDDLLAKPCCDATLQCRSRCSASGYYSRLYCSGGTWLAGLGLFTCDSP